MAATHKMVNGELVELDSPEAAAIEAAWAAAPTAAQIAAAQLVANKTPAKEVFADSDADPQMLPLAVRGLALVALDEINLLRQWIVSFKAAVAAATSLSNLQTRVAALNNMPDRTASQLRSAIRDKIDAE